MRSILGARIRERRRKLKISQAELARRIGISASYLNLIEHNKRSIAGALLREAASALNMPLEELDGIAERRLMATLEEIAHVPSIAALGAEAERAGELIGRYPGWAKTVVSLARAEREATDLARALSDRLTHDAFLGETVHRMLSGIAAVRSAAEIVLSYDDIDADSVQQFQQIIFDEARHLTQIGEALAAYFEKGEQSQANLTPQDEVETLFDKRDNRFEEIESLASEMAGLINDYTTGSREARARVVVEEKFATCIELIISDQSIIETELAKTRARQALSLYACQALLVPSEILCREAMRLRYDVEALSDVFFVPVETICQRLTALPRNEETPRFGYFLANAAGTIIALRSLPGLVGPRYASACPLWALYRAQQSPESIVRQRASFPSGARFVLLARARAKGPSGFGMPRHYVTDMLAMSERDAALTVYAPEESVPVEALGSSCRSCPRPDCMHRVFDPLIG